MSFGDTEKRLNSRLRAFLFSQIEETKDNVRLAYVLGARQKAGDTLNQQELDFLQEQEIEKRVLEKLENMLDKVEHPASARRVNSHYGLLGEREVFAVIRFFYLVRIAQQGFLPLIANAYPTLESEAIIYLADKLVAGSMGGITTIRHELQYSEMLKNETRNTARDIAFKLYREANEPVADGFKTTYKEIMQIAHCIAGQGIYEHQKKVGNSPAISLFEPSIASVPPVYVVLPHMSMIGDPKLSVPSVDPTLPIPGFLLSSKTADVVPPVPKDLKEDTASSAWTDLNAIVDDINTVPAKINNVETPTAASASEDVPDQTPVHTNGHVDGSNATDEEADETAAKDTEKTTKKKRSSSSKKNSKKSKSDRSKRAESKASEDVTTHDKQFQDQEPNNDNNSTKPIKNNEPQPQQQEQEEEDSEEDRFADADLSDDEHDILGQVHDNEVKDTTSMTQAQQTSGNATTPTPQADTTTNTTVPSSSQWQNFAATCHNDTDGSNTPLSPKSSTRSSPKIERR